MAENIGMVARSMANFAFRTLSFQGFTKSSIYYLSHDMNLDLDANGLPDEVDADATATASPSGPIRGARRNGRSLPSAV